MKKMCLLFLFLLIPFASSKIIFIEQPEAVYNLGDMLNVSFYIEGGEGYLETYLDCGERVLIFKKYISANNRLDFEVFAKMIDKDECRVLVKLDDEEGSSEEFRVTDEIEVNFEVNSKNFFPSEKIKIGGTAVKANGQKANGIVKVIIPSVTEQTADLVEGKFNFEYELSSRMPSKEYSVKIEVEDKEDSSTNIGKAENSFKVLPKPSFIEIVSNDSVKPPVEYNIRLSLLDQELKFFGNDTILYKIYDPANEMIESGSLLSGGEVSIGLPDAALKNAWKINAYFGNVFATKQFFVEENKKILIEVENNSNQIKISNLGNTYYEGVVNVKFTNNDSSEILPINVNLSSGDSLAYPVEIRGTYNLSVEGSESQFVELEGFYSLVEEPEMIDVPLTGAAIGSALKKNILVFSLGFLIVILIFSAAFFTLRKRKKVVSTPPVRILEKNCPVHKKIYTLFINIDLKDTRIAENLARGYKLHKINDNLYFITFIALSSDRSELRLIGLIRELKKHLPQMSSVLHCEKFENKASSIKSAFVSKQLIGLVKGNYFTGEVYNSIKDYRSLSIPEARSIDLKERVIKLFEIKN